MKTSISFALLTFVALSVCVHGGGGPSTVNTCNRGFRYNKKEDFHRKSPSLQKKRGGFDHCEGVECELFAILEAELLETLEAVECLDCPETELEQPNDTRTELEHDTETLDDLDLDQRRSWKEEPKRGSCYDENLGYLFDCNLIKILEDGQVLVEDLQSGGAFAVQPSTFHLHKKEKKRHKTNAPDVVVTGEDPNEDFRTNVELNMMGI